MVDTLLAGKLDRFNYNLYMLHQTVELTKPVLEGMKTAMAVQWFLGNIFLIIFFSGTITLLILHFRRIRKSWPGFKISKRYFILYSSLFLLFLLGFNFLPQMGMEQVQIESKSHKK